MPDSPRKTLTPSQLAEALQRLEEVMTEAARLRREITRQMAEQLRHQQMKVSTFRRRTRRRSSSPDR
jgi:hypothetical protein